MQTKPSTMHKLQSKNKNQRSGWPQTTTQIIRSYLENHTVMGPITKASCHPAIPASLYSSRVAQTAPVLIPSINTPLILSLHCTSTLLLFAPEPSRTTKP